MQVLMTTYVTHGNKPAGFFHFIGGITREFGTYNGLFKDYIAGSRYYIFLYECLRKAKTLRTQD